MHSSNAEKAISDVSPARASAFQDAVMAGRASRDAEVAELTRLLAESRAANGDSEARRAELEAVIEKVRSLCHTMDRGIGYRVSGDHSTWGEYHEGKSDFSGEVEELLDTAPSVVLEDRSEYTTTTESVRHAYADLTHTPVAGQMFDRWLEARDRENRAIGWDEGFMCRADMGVLADNPYRGDNR